MAIWSTKTLVPPVQAPFMRCSAGGALVRHLGVLAAELDGAVSTGQLPREALGDCDDLLYVRCAQLAGQRHAVPVTPSATLNRVVAGCRLAAARTRAKRRGRARLTVVEPTSRLKRVVRCRRAVDPAQRPRAAAEAGLLCLAAALGVAAACVAERQRVLGSVWRARASVLRLALLLLLLP
eukprot:m51a1_g10882 hypothetical protein (180) ;mRNA; r:6570-7581